MIQDAHPMRSGVPDCYRALYKIDIVSSGVTHTVNMERFPSGFGGVAGGTNAFVSTGRMDITYPPGMRVRGAQASVDSKLLTAAQFNAEVVNVNETAGTASIIVTDSTATPALANPATGAVVYAELVLETV